MRVLERQNRGAYLFRVRGVQASFRVDKRAPVAFAALAVALLLLLILNTGMGSYWISPPDVIKTVAGISTENPDHAFIVRSLRIPRALTAMGVGAALAVSGAILQGLTRNPLADPGIVGISQGAGLAAVALIVAVPSAPVSALPPVAFLGALGTALLIYRIAWKNGAAPMRLVLAGIGIAAVFASITNVLITFGEINTVTKAVTWLTGSVYARGWDDFAAFIPWLIVCFPLVMLMASTLDSLMLGDSMAKGLGSRVELHRFMLLLLAVALAGAAVATTGTIAFVGLVAPHAARRMVGPLNTGLIPVAAITGALIVLAADTVGRTLFAPTEIPAGIFTAIVGVPFFLYVLRRASSYQSKV